ncbi:hypothetical protein G7Z17_g865 [Cylindrodendrum hubeiense]|uniref:FAD-binding PCMH-type domain-containing protein n=1 Tax=Cylindrodendrum hubeiense TaxID=595255 RepID=A0A9P5HNZ2_9HYPO|nr:hypothetical protein G7Z17_g865 [Cylindrodendrum hubeiense]
MWDQFTNDTCLPNEDFPCTATGYPAYVVNATTPKHVKLGIDFARKHHIRLVVKNTGHDFIGRSIAPGALSLWTHHLNDIEYHEGSFKLDGCDTIIPGNAVTVGAGAQMYDIYSATDKFNETIVGGGGKSVGIGGYITGGGHSILSPRYGLAADQVLQMELVTPTGKTLTVNENQHFDLFWAMRGGGGSTFGVITAVTLKTHPSPKLLSSSWMLLTDPDAPFLYDAIAYTLSQFPSLGDAGLSGYSVSISSMPNPIPSPGGHTEIAGIGGRFILQDTEDVQHMEDLLAPLNETIQARWAGSVQVILDTVFYGSFLEWFNVYYDQGTAGNSSYLVSRLLDKSALESNATSLAAAVKEAMRTSGNFMAYIVSGRGVHDAVPRGGSDAANPGWRKSYVHSITAQGFPAFNETARSETISDLNGAFELIRELAPDTGAYINELKSKMGAKSEANVVAQDVSGEGPVISEKYADITLRIVEEHGKDFGPLTPEKEKKLRFKLYLHIDKSTLGYAAILGLFEETGISKAQYNNLGTFFYVGYLAAQWPGHYAMQKLPFGKFVAGLVFMWGATVLLHCAATTYAGLVILRLLLGASESVVVPAMEMTIGMFFNRHEQSFLQPFLWVTSAAAPICAAFISYGLLWSESSVLPWKLFMIVTGGISVLLSVVVWFYYPNNPAEAKFLTLEEKVHTIQRVHESSQSSIEQKQFKKEQFIETLRDPVSWLFCLQAFTLMLSNNLTYGQQNLITVALGVTSLGSTLVAAAGGGFGVLVCLAGTFALRWWPKNLALHGLVWCIPAIAGGIGMVTISWDAKLGMLACLLLAGHTYGNTYIIALGWATSSAAGYTKKLTRNVLFMVGYSVANLISPQIWVPSDAPRYYGAWVAQIVISWVGTPVILFVIQIILKRRNAERKAWEAGLTEEERASHQLGEVEQLDEGGVLVRRKVDIALLDLTDLENPFFVYPI